jgi:hypothetical protein
MAVCKCWDLIVVVLKFYVLATCEFALIIVAILLIETVREFRVPYF